MAMFGFVCNRPPEELLGAARPKSAKRARRGNAAPVGYALTEMNLVIEESALQLPDAPAMARGFRYLYGISVEAAIEGYHAGPPEFIQLLDMIGDAEDSAQWKRLWRRRVRKTVLKPAKLALRLYMLTEKSARAGLFAPGGHLEKEFDRLSAQYALLG